MHISEWFKNHNECPVTCCNCKCFAIDLPLLGEKDKKELTRTPFVAQSSFCDFIAKKNDFFTPDKS
jgi:hypothetical protein